MDTTTRQQYCQGFLDAITDTIQKNDYIQLNVDHNKSLDARTIAHLDESEDFEYHRGRCHAFIQIKNSYLSYYGYIAEDWQQFIDNALTPYRDQIKQWAQSDSLTDRPDAPTFDPEPMKPTTRQSAYPQLITTPLSEVEGKIIQWFWPNRMPSGMLSLLVGNPGCGKSFLTMYMCSRITTGQDWPDAKNTIEPGSVLLFSDEESLEYAIKPRLDAHGADCSKVFAVNHITRADGLPDTFSIDEHIQSLRIYLNQLPDCRLMIFDPITAYLGRVNANSNAEVRGALVGLQNLAEERNITILGINHFSKKPDLDVIYRTLGSTAFVAAARSAWAVAIEKQDNDCDDEPRRILAPIKSNYSINPTTLSYQIIDGKVEFDEGESNIDIDAIMQGTKNKGKKKPNMDKAKEFLQAELEGKAFVYAKEIIEKAKEQSISRNILYKAKDELEVLDWKDGFGTPVKWALESL